MKKYLSVSRATYNDLLDHLLPTGSCEEQAAFLFSSQNRSAQQAIFETIEVVKLGPADFTRQEGDFLEMADETRASLIKRAHDLEACMVEIHSHPGPWPAVFSAADRIGLQETVPYMWWRLRSKPYLALVVARAGFDALIWMDDPNSPSGLDGLIVEDHFLSPTNNSLRKRYNYGHINYTIRT